MNLAYTELFLVLAALFRRYDAYNPTAKQQVGPSLQLYDTIRERDINLDADLATPWPKAGSQGLRIRVMG